MRVGPAVRTKLEFYRKIQHFIDYFAHTIAIIIGCDVTNDESEENRKEKQFAQRQFSVSSPFSYRITFSLRAEESIKKQTKQITERLPKIVCHIPRSSLPNPHINTQAHLHTLTQLDNFSYSLF